MTHSHHYMDDGSIAAYAACDTHAMRVQLAEKLSEGPARTAKELAAITGLPLVSVRSRLSVGCHDDKHEGPALFRKAVRVDEPGSRTKVWAYGLAEVAVMA